MNILFVANSVSTYGANRSMLDLILELKNEMADVSVLLYEHGEIEKYLLRNGVKVYIIPYEKNSEVNGDIKFFQKVFKLVKNIYYINPALKVVRDNQVDIIHSNASNIDFGMYVALKAKLPHVWHVRELMTEYLLQYDFPLLSAFLLRKSAKVIAISDYVREKRKIKKNGTLIYDGLDIRKYSIAKKNLLSGEEVRLLYCGQISKSKGTMDAVKAVEYIVKRGNKKIHLDIVGNESEYWYKMRSYIEKRNLWGYITYYGHQNDLRRYRESADIALMCSRNEALGRVTIESMLGEVLVIGANAGGGCELIRDGVTGYLYSPGNIDELVHKIDYVYQEKEKSRKIIKRAKKFAEENFDSKRYAKKIMEVYRELVP